MIYVTRGPRTETPKSFVFPGGEVGIKFDQLNYGFKSENHVTDVVARLNNSEEVMKLVMVKNALNYMFTEKQITDLVMPYVPYARQDRVCVPGESFSLQAFAQIINMLKFDTVTVFDPHSDVTAALFDNIRIITQAQIIRKFDAFDAVAKEGIFVSPDAGANKKTSELAKYYGHDRFIRADKLRNLHTGAIIETVVYADKLDGTYIIADDICDGGRTFTTLAKALRDKGAKKVVLYVTHGIFSAGIDPLFEQGIDEIYTTTSFSKYNNNRLKVLPLEDVFDFGTPSF